MAEEAIKWRRCDRCAGAGTVESIIEEGKRYACSGCGGHGRLPEEVDGAAWFLRWRADRRLQRVAVLQYDWDRDAPGPDQWRVTIFDRRGPFTHYTGGAAEVMEHLEGFRPSTVAPRWLDHWSTRQEWRDGVDHMTLLAYGNLFSFHGLRKESRAVHFLAAREGMAPALALAARLKRRHLPDEDLF